MFGGSARRPSRGISARSRKAAKSRAENVGKVVPEPLLERHRQEVRPIIGFDAGLAVRVTEVERDAGDDGKAQPQDVHAVQKARRIIALVIDEARLDAGFEASEV